jgi:hypothetical protein
VYFGTPGQLSNFCNAVITAACCLTSSWCSSTCTGSSKVSRQRGCRVGLLVPVTLFVLERTYNLQRGRAVQVAVQWAAQRQLSCARSADHARCAMARSKSRGQLEGARLHNKVLCARRATTDKIAALTPHGQSSI